MSHLNKYLEILQLLRDISTDAHWCTRGLEILCKLYKTAQLPHLGSWQTLLNSQNHTPPSIPYYRHHTGIYLLVFWCWAILLPSVHYHCYSSVYVLPLLSSHWILKSCFFLCLFVPEVKIHVTCESSRVLNNQSIIFNQESLGKVLFPNQSDTSI